MKNSGEYHSNIYLYYGELNRKSAELWSSSLCRGGLFFLCNHLH